MKKSLFIPLILLCLAGCDDVKPAPEEKEEQTLICTLTAPANNSEIDIEDGSFEIAGNAMVNTGAISAVELKVGNDIIEEVTSVPFSYTYAFDEDQAAGDLVIVLTATGDQGAQHSVNVMVTLVEDGSEVVLPQEITATLTAPENGIEWVSDAPLTIAGEAVLSKGSVKSVTLTVGNDIIAEVTEVPFTYDYVAPDGLPEGKLLISLEVVGDEGGRAVAKTAVIHVLPVEPTPPPVPEQNEFVDPRDGKAYKTVTLGTQVWMAENLAWLPEVSPAEKAAETGTKKYYFVLNYNGSKVDAAKKTEEYSEYGVLYNWYAANDCADDKGADAGAVPSGVRGACPEGWHLPSKAEWQILENWVAGQLDPVTGQNSSYETDDNMKNVWSALSGVDVGWGESGMIDENPDLVNGPRDLFGFCVKPAGVCWQTGEFGESDSNTYFWLTDMQTYGGGCVNFSNSYYYIVYSKSGYNAHRAYPVRCVKD